MAHGTYSTNLEVINDAAVELGLISTDVSDPFASTDQNILLLNRLLTSLGKELSATWDWSHLAQRYSFNTSIGTNSYTLPAGVNGFGRMNDQSIWNHTTQMPVSGPLSPQEWEYLQTVSSSPAITTFFRIFRDSIWVYPTPTAVETIEFGYQSSFWVATAVSTTASLERVTAKTQYPHFDPLLLVKGLKMKFLQAKGFDSSYAVQEYETRLDQAKAMDPAPLLTLNGQRGTRLLTTNNIPVTGYGS